ncbi:50S ribosomal protein L3 N(5)-glutamine methyltransferase [Pigmentiphaga aceris]|uniref:50S ribosomal protein L3 N(5)-glutamine methyltransferase n=1 Tax=Pigmentiphaga aceris TaxID=1940612 RepID=A0A5C0B707_9BURK|nr:50S ribosomal protein L3 N(5)-glutamine methyltransferase [Pigmentiphaga aceris]QEI09320.1 50S ribosomal protein L3 N(5)-glutamine methyltransferase [Pigmentiphaga aceris]
MSFDMPTVGEVIEHAEARFLETEVFFGHGSLEAYDEAVYLVLFALGLPPDELDPYLDQILNDEQFAAIETLINRRIDERVPAAYLTGEAWLMGRSFRVDPRVIIPRSFIAELLEEGLSPWVEDPAQVGRMLDMCTGSACLAILAAQDFPNAQVDAVDLSSDALAVAVQNVADYELESRVRLHRSDLFASLPAARYDVIICNPPYVNADSMNALPPEYHHEPELALAGGTDGMDLIRVLLRDAPRFMNDHGILVLEIGNEREFFEKAFPKLEPVWLSTSAGDDQVLLLRRDQL